MSHAQQAYNWRRSDLNTKDFASGYCLTGQRQGTKQVKFVRHSQELCHANHRPCRRRYRQECAASTRAVDARGKVVTNRAIQRNKFWHGVLSCLLDAWLPWRLAAAHTTGADNC